MNIGDIDIDVSESNGFRDVTTEPRSIDLLNSAGIDPKSQQNIEVKPISIDIEKSVSDSNESQPIMLDPVSVSASIQEVDIEGMTKELFTSPTSAPEFVSINEHMRRGLSEEEAIEAVNRRRGATTGGQLGELANQAITGFGKVGLGAARTIAAPIEFATGTNFDSLDRAESILKNRETKSADRYGGINIPKVVSNTAQTAVGLANLPSSIIKAVPLLGAMGTTQAYSDFRSDSEALQQGLLTAGMGAGLMITPKILSMATPLFNMLSKSGVDMEKQAIKTLRDKTGITEEEAEKLVLEYKRFVKYSSKDYDDGIELKSLVHRLPSDTAISIFKMDNTASSNIRKFMYKQAEVLKADINRFSDPSVGEQSVEHLKRFIKTSDRVLASLADNVKDVPTSKYGWTISDVVDDTFLKTLQKTVLQPEVLKLRNMIKTMSSNNMTTKTVAVPGKEPTPLEALFGDVATTSKNIQVPKTNSAKELIEFRSSLTDYATTAKGKMSAIELNSLSKVFKAIDSEINKMAKVVSPEPDKLLFAYKEALSSRIEANKLVQNKMYKDITSQGLSPEQILSKYQKYINSTDKTFLSVVEKLPVKMINTVETTILAKALEKNTKDGVVDFVSLNKDIGGTNFRTKEAMQTQALYKDMGKVFTNNPQLLDATQGFYTHGENTGIFSIDIARRAATSLVTWAYTYSKSFLPTAEGARRNAIIRVNNVLKNPLDQKGVEELMKSLPRDQAIKAKQYIDTIRQEQLNLKFVKDYANGQSSTPKAPTITTNTSNSGNSGRVNANTPSLGVGALTGAMEASTATNEQDMQDKFILGFAAGVVGTKVGLGTIKKAAPDLYMNLSKTVSNHPTLVEHNPELLQEALKLQSRDSAGMFVGEKALKINLRGLAQAKEMQEAGKSRNLVFLTTGWYKSKIDDQWRIEIDDSKSEMVMNMVGRLESLVPKTPIDGGKVFNRENFSGSIKLSSIFKHPELYKAYPQLKDIRVNIGHTEPLGAGGWFDSKNNMITLGIKQSETNKQAVLIHEIQHVIQDIEGFSGGTNNRISYSSLPIKERAEVVRAIAFAELTPKTFSDELKEFVDDKGNLKGETLTEQKTNLVKAERFLHKEMGFTKSVLRDMRYRTKGGEIESRNSSLRFKLGKKKSILPWKDQDVDEKGIIIK